MSYTKWLQAPDFASNSIGAVHMQAEQVAHQHGNGFRATFCGRMELIENTGILSYAVIGGEKAFAVLGLVARQLLFNCFRAGDL